MSKVSLKYACLSTKFVNYYWIFIFHFVRSILFQFNVGTKDGALEILGDFMNCWDMGWAVRNLDCNPVLPVVFIGGKYVDASKYIIFYHLDGSLKQMLNMHKPSNSS